MSTKVNSTKNKSEKKHSSTHRNRSEKEIPQQISQSSTSPSRPRTSRVRQLEEENVKLKERISQLESTIIRLNAELANLRKRYDREMERILIYSNEKLLEKLLPLIDDLDRAIRAADVTEDFVGFKNGVEMIYKNLLAVLEAEGVKPIKALGSRFDYNLHEAVSTQKAEGVEPGVVIAEVQKGFMYKDKVLRHAKVVVSE